MSSILAIVILHAVSTPDAIPYRTLKFTSNSDAVHIGRSSKREVKNLTPQSNNGLFDSRVMSRRHARIHVSLDQQVVYISDDGSMHGTWVNDRKLPVRQDITLRTGDVISFGAEVIRGHESFPPLKVRCEFQWIGPTHDSASTTNGEVKHGTNTFCVPEDDYEDEDEDDEIEMGDSAPVVSIVESGSGSEVSVSYSDSDDKSVVEIPSPLTSPLKGEKHELTGTQHSPIEIELDEDPEDQPLATPRMTPPPIAEATNAGFKDMEAHVGNDGDIHGPHSKLTTPSVDPDIAAVSQAWPFDEAELENASCQPSVTSNSEESDCESMEESDWEKESLQSSHGPEVLPPVYDKCLSPLNQADGRNESIQGHSSQECATKGIHDMFERAERAQASVFSEINSMPSNNTATEEHVHLPPASTLLHPRLVTNEFRPDFFVHATPGWSTRQDFNQQTASLQPSFLASPQGHPRIPPAYTDGPFACCATQCDTNGPSIDLTIYGKSPSGPPSSKSPRMMPLPIHAIPQEDKCSARKEEFYPIREHIEGPSVVETPSRTSLKRKLSDADLSPVFPSSTRHGYSPEVGLDQSSNGQPAGDEDTFLPDAQPQSMVVESSEDLADEPSDLWPIESCLSPEAAPPNVKPDTLTVEKQDAIDPSAQAPVAVRKATPTLTIRCGTNTARMNSINRMNRRDSRDSRDSRLATYRAHATTAAVGAVIGAVGTVALLASLPADYFL